MRIKISILLSLFAFLGARGLAQEAPESPKLKSSVDKLYFGLRTVNLKKYNTVEFRNFVHLQVLLNDDETWGGFSYERILFPLQENNVIASYSRLWATSDTTSYFHRLGVRYSVNFGYNQIEYGLGFTFLRWRINANLPNAYVGYKRHNPTKRLVFGFGFQLYPSNKTRLVWTQINLGYAFNLKRKRISISDE